MLHSLVFLSTQNDTPIDFPSINLRTFFFRKKNIMALQNDAETLKVQVILFKQFFITLQTFKLSFLKAVLSHISTLKGSSKANFWPIYVQFVANNWE